MGRSKMYSLLMSDGETKKTAKGISSHVTANVLRHQDYKDCLFEGASMVNTVTRIGHINHELKTIETRKSSLSCFNDKKWMTRDESEGFTSLSFGHKDIKN